MASSGYALQLRPMPGVDGIKALRALLKNALRAYGLRCISVCEAPSTEEIMANEEFRQALARVVHAMGDILGSRCVKDVPCGALDYDQASWIAARAIYVWSDAQRRSVGLRYEQFAEVLPELGALPPPWAKPLRDWSKGQVVDLLSGALTLVLARDRTVPPFLKKDPPENLPPLADEMNDEIGF
jgi:hypothetical protein